LSLYIDSLTGGVIAEAFQNAMPMNVSQFASYPDFLAFSLVLVTIGLLIVGVKEPTFLNMIFTVLNLAVIIFLFIAAAINAKISNWQLTVQVNQKL
jgi:amino acid transporter